MVLTPLQKLPNNVGNFGKIIAATGFEWLPKVQKIAHSGHTAVEPIQLFISFYLRAPCLNWFLNGPSLVYFHLFSVKYQHSFTAN